MSGFLVTMVGLVIAGPWLTMAVSRLLAGRANRPATIIAARRLADDPRAGFRAVSGLMLALFVTSVATGVITTIVANRGTAPDAGSVYSTAMSKIFWPEEMVDGSSAPPADALPPGLTSMPGVRSVTVVRVNPDRSPTIPPGLIACADLEPVFGRCAPGATVAAVYPYLIDFQATQEGARDVVWPAADTGVDALGQLPVLSFVVDTDGTAAVVERVRTTFATALPDGRFVATEGEFESDFTQALVQWQHLANVVILTSLPIAAASLAVSVTAGLIDRKRPFSLLRLAGAQLSVLRRVVLLESAVPLLAVALLATGIGFLAAHLFLRAQLQYSLTSPGVGYYVTVAAGLAASLGIIASTLPLLRRVTGPETARND